MNWTLLQNLNLIYIKIWVLKLVNNFVSGWCDSDGLKKYEVFQKSEFLKVKNHIISKT